MNSKLHHGPGLPYFLNNIVNSIHTNISDLETSTMLGQHLINLIMVHQSLLTSIHILIVYQLRNYLILQTYYFMLNVNLLRANTAKY